jgi:uncharacterized protein (TIGR02466 family)
MPVEYWFPTTFFARDLDGQVLENVQNEISAVISKIKEESTLAPTGGNMMTTFLWGKGNANDIYKYQLTNLKEAIKSAVDDYTIGLNYKGQPFEFGGSWFNISGRGGSHYDHVHPYTRIAGTYYFQTNGIDGNLKLQNPNPIMHMGGFPSDMLSDEAIKVPPKVGRLVLFPSWLTHRVEMNDTDSERISIAFNIN